MSARQNKKRKGRNHVNNRERTVTTFTEDPNTSFLVPLASEEPPQTFTPSSFSMNYQFASQQQQFYQPVLPPGKNDLEILENLKSIIKDGQHEFYRAVPQPAVLASLYMGHISQPPPHPDQLPPEYPHFASVDNTNAHDANVPSRRLTRFSRSPFPQTIDTPLSGVDTSPNKTSAQDPESNMSSAQPEPEDTSRTAMQGPPGDTSVDAAGEYGARQLADTAPNKTTPLDATKDDEPPQSAGENAWDRRTLDDRKALYNDHNAASRTAAYDNRPQNGTATDAHLPPPEDRRLYDRDRDRDRDNWDRDRDRHDLRDRTRDRDVRDRRPEFFGRSYGRSHAPRPPPELRHYEPSYGDDYVPPARRYDDDRRGGLRNSFDDRSKPPPFNDRKPPLDDRRPPPPSDTDDRRLPLDDRTIRRPPGSDTRALPPSSEDRIRPVADSVPLARATAEDERSARAPSLAAEDRSRTNVPLEERLSQPAPTPSLQDRLSQPAPAAAPARPDIASAPSLEERLSSAPVPPRAYARAASVARDDLRAPLPKDDLREHDRINDFRTNRDFSRERPGLTTASTYRPDLDRSFDRGDRDRRDHDVTEVDAAPARYGDTFGRVGPPPPRRYSPPPVYDRDRDRERGRAYYPLRSPQAFREGVYDADGDRRYTTDRERDVYEQRRRDWYGPGDDDKRGPPPPPPSTSWRPHDRPPFVDRDRERFDRERDRDIRERERERDRDLGGLPPPPPTRGHWDDRDRRGFPISPPHSRMDTMGGMGPVRSLSARLTDPYLPPPGGDDRAYPPSRDFDRGRYGGPALDDHAHGHVFSRVRNRSPSPPRRGPGLAEDLRPPVKRLREDSGTSYPGVGLGVGGGAYSPPRRGGGGGTGGGEYAPGPPPSSAATTTTTGVSNVSGTISARSTGTRTPPMSAPPPNSAPSGAFYERDQREREQREREREREYVRGEYGMGYDRDNRGRRSPPMVGSRAGSGGYGKGVVGDRRDDRRYAPPPPRTS